MSLAPENNNGHDLTQGSISRGIWKMAIPAILGNIAQTTNSFVDTFWVSKTEGGSSAIAALGNAGHVMFLIFPIFMGFSVAASALVSRAVGAKNYDHANHNAAQAMFMTFIAAIVVGIIGNLLLDDLLGLMGTNKEAYAIATPYLRVLLVGGLPMFSIFVGAGILRGAGDARTPLIVMLTGATLNILLDPLFIFTFKLGVTGAAYATVTAQSISFIIAMIILIKGRGGVKLHLHDMRLQLETVMSIFKLGLPPSINLGLRAAMGAVILSLVNPFGDAVTAAHTLGARFHHIAFMAVFSIANSTGVMVGQSLGAKNPNRAHKSGLRSVRYNFLIMALAGIVFAIFGKQFMSIFAPDNIATQEAGAMLLKITAPGLIFSAIGISFSRAVIGAGDTVPPMIFGIIGLWAVQIPLASYLSKTELGVAGVWSANVAAAVALASMTSIYFYFGSWKEKVISVDSEDTELEAA